MRFNFCMPGLGQGSGPGNIGILILKGSFLFINFPVQRNFANPSPCSGQDHPLFQYSNIPVVPARHRSRSGEAGGSEAN